ncbi:MAG: hypothetical protein R3B70_37645 [Polyangiaceae bacterium]
MAKMIRPAAALLALTLASPAFAEPEPAPAAPAKEDAAPAKQDATPANDITAKDAPTEAPELVPEPASPPAEETPAWEKAPAERRAGFTVGLLIGGGIGSVTGFPADIEKRNKDEFRTEMGATLGGGATLFLGGALTDWLVFGAGIGGGAYTGGGTNLTGFTFVFHTEVFPLYWLGGTFRDLGIAFDTGAGSFTGEVADKPAGPEGDLIAPVIESGAASRVGTTLFYDGLRVSKLSAGPFVSFDYTWSSTLTQPIFLVGWRTALYAKAPKPSAKSARR